MTHCHNTKKARSKRVDVRSDYRKRTQQRRLEQDKAVVKDFRVTKLQKGEKKEREVTHDMKMKKSDGLSTKDEAFVRSLRKKLRDIEELMKKQGEGVDLNDAQLEKISKLDDVIAKLQEFNDR